MSRHWLIGIDEAGRGPLAGPVAVGVFAVPDNFPMMRLRGIRDSKQLTAHARDTWYAQLTSYPECRFAVGLVGAGHIDSRGIVSAIRTALARALARIQVSPQEASVLLDGGLRAPTAYRDQTTIIKGDVTEPMISAAAILAKVTRDRYMTRADARYPSYGFASHKGYGTPAHIAAIRKHGLTPLHRATFIHVSNSRTVPHPEQASKVSAPGR